MTRLSHASALGALSLCFLLCCIGSAAGAQDGLQVAATSGDQYHRVIEEALQEFNLGNWDEAAVMFERAHSINPSARTLRGMGMAAFEARHYVAAIAHFHAALQDQRNPLTAVQREEAQRALSRAQDYVARIALDVTPNDARIRVNGRAVETDRHGDYLAEPGVQEVEIAADGYESVVRRLHAASGKRETLSIKLRPTAPGSNSVADEPNDSSLGSWKWALGVGGVVSLAVGSAFLVAQKTEANRFNDMCNPDMLTAPCEALERSAGGRWYVGSFVGLGLGVGLISASVVMFLLDRQASKPEHARRNGCQLGFADLGVTCQLTL